MAKTRLLVIDDAPSVLKALRDTLEAHGYEVYEAINGEEALIRYREVKPDVVLMDILMPEMDGLSATKCIMGYDQNAKVIVLTAMGKRGLEKDCIEAGASDFIMKPYKTKDMLRTINSLVKDERN